MNNDMMMDTQSTGMMEPSALTTVEPGMMEELSDGDLDTVAGGCGFNLGDCDGFNQRSGNFYSKESFGVANMTFAGPEGSGTSSIAFGEKINSGAFQDTSIR